MPLPPIGFAAVWRDVEPIPGWLSKDQAGRLHAEVARLRPGATVLEIGSHHGRSTIALAAGREDVDVVAVDPFPAAWKYGSPGTREAFEHNLVAAGVRDRVTLRAQTSRQARGQWTGQIDFLYVDGKHDMWSAMDDFSWAVHLPPGGRMAVHDSFSSLGVTSAVLRRLLFSPELRFVDRVASLAVFEKTPPRARDRVRLLAQLGWFGRNAVIKVLLRLRLNAVAARLLGHRDSADPY